MEATGTFTCGSCGQRNRATDRFCNHCGMPLVQPTPIAPPPAATAPTSKCVVGHPIAAGAHFCAHGHPIALDSLHLTRSGLSSSPTPVPPPPVASVPPLHLMTPVSPAPAYASQESSYVAIVQGHAPVASAPIAPPPSSARVPIAAPAAPAPGREANVLRGFLVPLQGRPTQEYWALHGLVATVGRANTGDHVDVAVLDSTTSSRHAALHFDVARGIVYLEDLGSTNGTFVNDVPIGHNGRRELRDNDRVRFGGFSALLKLLPLL